MQKATYDKIVGFITSAGFDDYYIRFENSNRTLHSNSESCKLIPLDDCVLSIQTNENYVVNGDFRIQYVPYEDIETIAVTNLNIVEVMKAAESSGATLSDDIKKFLSKTANRVSIDNPRNRSNYGEIPIKDDKGNTNPELAPKIPARKVY